MSIKEIREWADCCARGESKPAPKKISDSITLREALAKFFTRPADNTSEDLTADSVKDIRRIVTLFAFGWLDHPVTTITPDMVTARIETIKSAPGFPHPLWIKNKEQRVEKATEIKAKAHELGLGVPHKEFVGSKIQADSFARYLRTVLMKSSDAFTKGEDPVTKSEHRKIIGKKINYERPALPMRENEIAAILNFTRKHCTNSKHGYSTQFDALLWQKFLALKLGLFTGYRVGDIVSLHDGNDHGDRLTKGKGECTKRSTATHTLPVSVQMRAVIDEAVALRDKDRDTLKKSFGWTKAEIAALDHKEFGFKDIQSSLIFPSLKMDGKKYSQPSQVVRPAFVKLDFKNRKQDRRTSATDWHGTKTAAKPHDTRSTFATVAAGSGVDMFTVASFMNHSLPVALQTAAYVGGTDSAAARVATDMQTIADSLTEIATSYRSQPKLIAIK